MTSFTNMPLVWRLEAASSGTPSGPRISTSTSSQRYSESMRRPSMSKMAALNARGAATFNRPGTEERRSGGEVGGDRLDDRGVLGLGPRTEAADDLARGGDH